MKTEKFNSDNEDLRNDPDLIKRDAHRELAQLKAMNHMALSNDDCEAKLTIDGYTHAFSSSGIFISVIDREIKEIKKALKGRSNKWQ